MKSKVVDVIDVVRPPHLEPSVITTEDIRQAEELVAWWENARVTEGSGFTPDWGAAKKENWERQNREV